MKVGGSTRLVSLNRHDEHRALETPQRMASRRVQQPGKPSAAVHAEHNQIRVEFVCNPDDLVLNQTDGDLKVHSSVHCLR